ARVVTAGADGRARISSATTGEVVRSLAGHAGAILCARLSPSGRRLLTGGAAGRAVVHDLETGATLARAHVADADVTCVGFSPDEASFVAGSSDRTVRLFDASGAGPGRVLYVGRRMRPSQVRVFAVEFHPDGRSVAASFEGGDTVLVSVDGSRVLPLGPQVSPVGGLRFDESGRRLFGLYKWGGRTFVFDTETGGVEQNLYGHSSSMTALDLTPDGRLLVTGSFDGTARLWRVADGAEWATIAGHGRPLVAACFSPDGRQVLTASRDGRARIWPTDALATAERVLPRELAPESLNALLEGG
ncbi:MAG: WD40 repeat domain-containing protein, partial [Planctomycetota bacterium JB042]